MRIFAVLSTGTFVILNAIIFSADSGVAKDVPLSFVSSQSSSSVESQPGIEIPMVTTEKHDREITIIDMAANTDERVALPARINLPVPFSSQAPNGDWNEPYQNACEETSLLMVNAYLKQKALTADSVDLQIRELIGHNEKFGLGPSITLEQTAEIARSYFGLETQIINDITATDIKRALADGNPVIVPAAGRMLQNPYFTGGGPWYHMLVIIGYENDTFITNDPGTSRGASYPYEAQLLTDAIHDWTGIDENIQYGGKAGLILKNPQ